MQVSATVQTQASARSPPLSKHRHQQACAALQKARPTWLLAKGSHPPGHLGKSLHWFSILQKPITSAFFDSLAVATQFLPTDTTHISLLLSQWCCITNHRPNSWLITRASVLTLGVCRVTKVWMIWGGLRAALLQAMGWAWIDDT